MAKARALDRRRKSIRNIRKITRTMELISTARFKRAMDRATAAAAYTRRITALVGHLADSGLEVAHPLLRPRPEPQRRCCWCSRPTAGSAAATTPASLRLANAHYAQTARPKCPRCAGGRRQAGHLGLPLPQDAAGRDVHPLRGQAQLRRGRRAGQPLPARTISTAGSTGWTWSIRSSRAPAASSAVAETLLPHRRLRGRRSRAGFQPAARESSNCGAAAATTSSCPRPRASWTSWCR